MDASATVALTVQLRQVWRCPSIMLRAEDVPAAVHGKKHLEMILNAAANTIGVSI